MVNPHRNGPEMMPYDAPDSDQLEELQELNLLFLIYLRSCAREGGDCLGIPTGTAAKLRELSMTALQAMSDFPRSLFNVDLDNISAAREHFELPRTALEQSTTHRVGAKPAGAHTDCSAQRVEYESQSRVSGPYVSQAVRDRDAPSTNHSVVGVNATGCHAPPVDLRVPGRPNALDYVDQSDRDRDAAGTQDDCVTSRRRVSPRPSGHLSTPDLAACRGQAAAPTKICRYVVGATASSRSFIK
jgi:hypothetical protein